MEGVAAPSSTENAPAIRTPTFPISATPRHACEGVVGIVEDSSLVQDQVLGVALRFFVNDVLEPILHTAAQTRRASGVLSARAETEGSVFVGVPVR